MAVSKFKLLLLLTSFIQSTFSQFGEFYCCNYCRAEQTSWMKNGNRFQLSTDVEVTAMMTPGAMMVEESQSIPFKISNREYLLNYAGAPVRVESGDPDSVIRHQFVEVDLAQSKAIGGVISQGGFYEEQLLNLYPRSETWVTEFALSFSNNSIDFSWKLDEDGDMEVFSGNDNAWSTSLTLFDIPVSARYLRFHPVRAENEEGSTNRVNARVSVVVCSQEPCSYPQISCLMSQWSAWSDCACTGSCTQTRSRVTERTHACGGEQCEASTEERICESDDSWQTYMIYAGPCLGAIIVILLVALIAYKKTHRDRVQVIVVGGDDDDDDDDLPPAPRLPRGPGMGPRVPRPGMPGMRPGFGPNMGPRPRFSAPTPGGGMRMGGNAGGVAPINH